tara:strand:+ start:219 stop:632 length:414 start_codon:yes stop_codon:yes gene_type:complete
MAIVDTFIKQKQQHEVQQGLVGYSSRIFNLGETNITNGDTVYAFKVKKGTTVLNLGARVITASDPIYIIDIGDGDDHDSYINSFSLYSDGKMKMIYDNRPNYPGKHYDSDGYIYFTPAESMSEGVFEIWIQYVVLSE